MLVYDDADDALKSPSTTLQVWPQFAPLSKTLICMRKWDYKRKSSFPDMQRLKRSSKQETENELLNPFADGRTQDNMQSANTVKRSQIMCVNMK